MSTPSHALDVRVFPPGTRRTCSMWRWLVIIARDRPELWVSWASFYGHVGNVEVLFDRRQASPCTGEDRPDRRSRPNLDALREHGFLVIPLSGIVGASR